MLAAKPIIHAIDAPHDIVAISSAGLSCPVENPEKLSQAIISLKSRPAEEPTAMGEKGSRRIRANRDYRLSAKDFLGAVSQ